MSFFSEDYARAQDAQDALRHLRAEFYFPEGENGEEQLYFCGNSLGLQPKGVEKILLEEVADWRKWAVEGHLRARRAWKSYHEQFAAPLARIVGAKESEVVAMGSLTANLHLLMVSFYRPTQRRRKIIIERGAFPSDKYAVDAQLRFHGFDAGADLVQLTPRAGEDCLRTEDILQTIQEQAEETALLMLSGVNYYTGQCFDMKEISAYAASLGIVVGWDLAHAAGNVPLQLHEWGVDFAAWCHYKYLNAGAGATAGIFVHEKHHRRTDLHRFAGWWGHDKESRFRMPDEFVPIATAESWQLSNAPVFALAPLLASLEVFGKTDMQALRQKSERLTGYLFELINQELAEQVRIITPADIKQRGAQLSLSLRESHRGREVHAALLRAGVVSDWREPNVIRVAPAPLYNSFADVLNFVRRLQEILR